MKPNLSLVITFILLISLSFSVLAQEATGEDTQRLLSDQSKAAQASTQTQQKPSPTSNTGIRAASKPAKSNKKILVPFNKMTTEEQISTIEQTIVSEHQLRRIDMELRIEKLEKLLEEKKIQRQRE